MKLAASYNFFNGEELLEKSITNLRTLVDHISVVYQQQSNLGNPITEKALNILKYLEEKKLIDSIIEYSPDLNLSPQKNEFQKRLIGYEDAKSQNCTHFLTIDADEFYNQKQFKSAKDYIEKNNISFSACPSFFYLHKPIYRSKELDITNVCFISKIDSLTSYIYGQDFPIKYIDSTRRITNKDNRFHFFSQNDLVMHHMNFVRKSFDSKLNNSSSQRNKKLRSFLKKVRNALKNWKFGKPFRFPNKGEFQIIQVKNEFSIDVEYIRKKFWFF